MIVLYFTSAELVAVIEAVMNLFVGSRSVFRDERVSYSPDNARDGVL